jgi:exodeoxyribonuclease-3
MKKISIMSWNVNGIRAISNKGFLAWLKKTKPDILGIQETKAHPDQLSKELLSPEGYFSYWHLGERKGYSGVGLYTKEEPKNLKVSFGEKHLDAEGRTMMADYGSFVLFNIYFPNGGQGDHRIKYKLEYYEAFLTLLKKLKKSGKKIIVCGDVNTAHTEIDLARPKENSTMTGFLPEERAWIDKLISAGFIDTFRVFNTKPDNYTWWDYKTRARERNVGWRIDYFFISENLQKNLHKASIYPQIQGSDHCPIGIELSI